ncbi:DUF7282 domain-containing protein [Halorarum salinum]|uniref:DUF7282 domain-containing protein n=1 Tax=Halorarum salinum TaxID=2743089 RepID=A0A7D5LD83_9EURY|nr:hypothetical protein [Halobaculum salinum]QLG63870.1 hypothetical protein HUG12_19955 [Halobaculum salinum]
MTKRRTVVSLVAALVVLSVFATAALTVGAQQEDGAQQAEPTGLVVDSIDAPAAVAPNGSITVTATISNPTDGELTEDVAYRLDGEEQDVVRHQEVTVAPGGTGTVEFTLEATNFGTGDYIHGVTTRNSSNLTYLDVTRDALVDFDAQESDGTQVVVESTFVPEGGYVTIHDESLLQGDALGSVVGVSEYLEPGYHQNVTIQLFDVEGAQFEETSLNGSQQLIAMPHRETNNDTTYGFVSSDGAQDGPYTVDGEAVTEASEVTVTSEGATGDGAATGGLAGDGDDADGNETTDEGTPALEPFADR